MKGPFSPHFVDFYKPGHANMFPVGLTSVYGNFTPRSDRLAKMLPDFDHKIVWFGAQGVLQYLLIELWNDTFFNRPKVEVIAKLKRRMDSGLGAGVVPMHRWEALHDLGYLPVEVRTIDEGNRVDIRVSPFTIEATHDDFAWVSQYLETQLSAELWPQLTSATIAYEYRKLLNYYAEKTGGDMNFVPFQAHDFSARGMKGIYDGAHSGGGHLISFTGTDTVAAIDYVEDYYPEKEGEIFIGGSIPATEHAVSSSNIIMIARQLQRSGIWNNWSVFDLNPTDSMLVDPLLIAETAFLKYCLIDLFPTGPFSYVADTYDFWSVISISAKFLKKEIMSRQPDVMGRPGKIVFRPDSGDPVKIILGDPEAIEGSNENLGAIRVLWNIFGGTINEKGYKVLDSHVGLIYGDSITLERAQLIMAGLEKFGFVSTSVVLGVGSYTYQYVTRDTFGTAMKGTFAIIDGDDYELFKDPKTDSGGVKKSAIGLLRVEKENGKYIQYDHQTREEQLQGELHLRFRNSKMFNMQSFSEVRNNL